MNEFHLLLSFIIGFSLLIFLILRTRVHIFPSLIISSAVIGLLSGLTPSQTVSAISSGFGNTLASIGIVIGLGVMLGKLLEVSGAAEKMAEIFIKSVGSGKENWALALTGAVVSISVFCDSGFVILISLAKSISKKSKFVFATLSISLASGLVVTHHNVPPTPGPLAVAGIFEVDIGLMILLGLIISIPIIISMVLYSTFSGEKINIPINNSSNQENGEKSIPPASISFLPIIIPIILILSKTVLDALKVSGIIMEIFEFAGSPVIAILLGLLIAIFGLARNFSLSETSKFIEKSLSSAGVIILITGAGGSLGNILRASGVGTYIADIAVSLSIPAVILPFLVSTVVRLAQGSGTVAMITSASIISPMMSYLHINPITAALACCVGSMFFSYFNDSYFWVVTRFTGLNVKEGIRVWSITTTIGWAVGLISLLIINLFI
ncbi:MAG: GntP family permease [Candidatus Helarchaeota archaeon]|nr:GntP family permease [Candidatus Helarchaeota archaeon]